jgi:hypothetical protein
VCLQGEKTKEMYFVLVRRKYGQTPLSVTVLFPNGRQSLDIDYSSRVISAADVIIVQYLTNR